MMMMSDNDGDDDLTTLTKVSIMMLIAIIAYQPEPSCGYSLRHQEQLPKCE